MWSRKNLCYNCAEGGKAMTIAIYAGSFDPFTNGHLDILKNSAEIFDKVIVAVSFNIQKRGFLPLDTRKTLILESIKNIPNVEVDAYEGLTVNYAKKRGASVLIRGLRNSADFEYEMQLAQTNNSLNNEIKTMFLLAKPEYSFISSSGVREILQNNGDVTKFVPKPVAKYLINNYGI
jgi:pantetheine-phosphate adenylyltransferase